MYCLVQRSAALVWCSLCAHGLVVWCMVNQFCLLDGSAVSLHSVFAPVHATMHAACRWHSLRLRCMLHVARCMLHVARSSDSHIYIIDPELGNATQADALRQVSTHSSLLCLPSALGPRRPAHSSALAGFSSELCSTSKDATLGCVGRFDLRAPDSHVCLFVCSFVCRCLVRSSQHRPT